MNWKRVKDAATKAAEVYDESYFETHCGDRAYRRDEAWLGFFRQVASAIVRDLHPSSALDAGCAMGFLVEALRDQGVDAHGIDISSYAIGQVREDVRAFCQEASVLEDFGRRYDLITCIEVAEHLDRPDAWRLVENLCRHAECVLFSSTPFDFEEETHRNVQPTEYWVELFARAGFLPDVEYDASYVTEWALLFRRSPDAQHVPTDLLRAYERQRFRLWIENQALRRSQTSQAAELEATTAERDSARADLEQFTSSSSYRLMVRIRGVAHRLLPPPSPLGRAVTSMVRRLAGRITVRR